MPWHVFSTQQPTRCTLPHRILPRAMALLIAAGACLAASRASAAEAWQALDPANTLWIATSKGDIFVEMRPDMAPQSVARVKQLSRERVYDGLQFHRVIPGFVAQTGNPNNRDGGTSSHPDLPPEFVFKLALQPAPVWASHSSDATQGLLGSVPFQGLALPAAMLTLPATPPATLRAWGAYCAGVAGMGRQEAASTGNSEVFFMLRPSRRLDRDYTVWGRIVVGFEVLEALAAGEPPANPDTMRAVRVLSDLPTQGRPQVFIESTERLKTRITQARAQRGADFSVCDVEVPGKVDWQKPVGG